MSSYPNNEKTEPSSRHDLNSAMKPDRVALCLAVLVPILWVPQAGIAALAIGHLAEGQGSTGIMKYAIGFAGIGLMRAFLDLIAGRRGFIIARSALSYRRKIVLSAMMDRSPINIRRAGSGEAASIFAEQAEMMTPWLARYPPARLKAITLPVVIALFIFPLSWVAALSLILTAPVIPLFMALIGMKAQAASEQQLSRISDMNTFLIDRLRGLTTIRTLGAVDITARRLRHQAEAVSLRTMAVLKIAFLTSATLELFSALGVALTAVYIGFHLLGFINWGTWGTQLSLEQGLFVLMITPAFFEPLRELSSVWHDRAAGEAASKALGLLAERGMPLPPKNLRPQQTGPLAVRINDLHYTHPDHKEPTIERFSLSVAKGEKLAILAPSGKGKSTLLSLIAGLATPQSGEILVDGMDPATARDSGAIAWIGQSSYIFPGSIFANVALGRSIDESRFRAAISTAGLNDVMAKKGKTPLGEGGKGLSGGEIVRLAIARADVNQYADLILADEPTAHLDTVTAQLITERLLESVEGRTLIIATHDTALAARMDRQIMLEG